MKFHDPDRVRLGNGRPCWTTALVALPHIYLDPNEDGTWQVAISVRGSIVSLNLPYPLLNSFLDSWEQDPEAALKTWLNRDPPSTETRAISLDDLELDI